MERPNLWGNTGDRVPFSRQRMSETIWFLKRCPLFTLLSDDELRSLESRSLARKFEKNSAIYLPMDAAESVFLMAKGRAKICHLTPEGKQSILAFIEPGELFGELSILDEGKREEYAEAVEATTVVKIPGDVMRELMDHHAGVSLGVTKLIGLRRRRIERRLKNLLFLSNRERLTHLLLELMEQYGNQTKEGIELRIRLSHQDLANVIGSTRETVTVVLGELQGEGLIQVGRRKIIICDAAGLAESVEQTPPPLPEDNQPNLGVLARQQ